MDTLIYAQIGNIINQAQAKTEYPEDELFVLKHALRKLSKGVQPDEAIEKALSQLVKFKPEM